MLVGNDSTQIPKTLLARKRSCGRHADKPSREIGKRKKEEKEAAKAQSESVYFVGSSVFVEGIEIFGLAET